MIIIPSHEKIITILEKQLSSYWHGMYDKKKIEEAVEIALLKMSENLQQSNMARFKQNDETVFSAYNTSQWSIFLYYLSNILNKRGDVNEACVVYYLNKVMHSVDWYYEIELPIHFMAEHLIGSVLGRANYGDYFTIYQGVTVGGNRRGNKIDYPTIGNNVLLYSNCSVLGNTLIGNNVIVSAGSLLINEIIPDNCFVFGRTPNIYIKKKSEEYMKQKTCHIWKIN